MKTFTIWYRVYEKKNCQDLKTLVVQAENRTQAEGALHDLMDASEFYYEIVSIKEA